MLLSWKHNFLFIHVAKTGGTALTQALTPFARFEDRLAYSGFGVPGVKRVLALTSHGVDPIEKYTGSHAHIRYREIIQRFDRNAIDELFKIAIVRNPFTRTYSLYSHLCRAEVHPWHPLVKGKTFPDVLPMMIEKGWLLQAPFFCLDSQSDVRMDYVGAMETLAEDAAYIADRLKLGRTLKLPRVNTDPQTAPDLAPLFEASMDAFLDALRGEFELFGYSTDIAHAHEPPEGGVIACSPEQREKAR